MPEVGVAILRFCLIPHFWSWCVVPLCSFCRCFHGAQGSLQLFHFLLVVAIPSI